ncbi:MAG: chemotaxis protein CheA [Blastochloris viridis]|uniref:Chemotaxis protein CheA n=1 Tax=Blastochloris viridis TaxID=1079 RepID=A0A6N4R0C6_BLAVI|nr:MAG: chemotaxis protein CheA [Blastochloris viridis]
MTMDDMGDELNEILEEFFTEADENLDTLEQDLIKLEALADGASSGTDQETVDRIFRMLHTLKGGAGFLGLEKIAKLAHSGENLLDEVRQGRVKVTKPVMDALLQTTDMLKQLVLIQKRREDDSDFDTTALREALDALATGQTAVEIPAAPVVMEAADEDMDDAAEDADMAADAEVVEDKPFNLLDEVLSDPTLDPSRDKEPEEAAPVVAAAPVATPVTSGVSVNAELLASVLNDPTLDPSRDKECEEDLKFSAPVAAAPAPAAAVGPAVAKAVPEEQRKGEDRRQAPRRNEEAGNDTIRVETSRLDKVMNLVGELVLARNTMLRQLNGPETRKVIEELDNATMIYSTMEQLSRVTQDLQMSVLSTRMQPIKKVFDKIPRQVRELKTQLKKEVNLIVEGEMTEVDKSLVEDLADPMVHMIRNALDHGIELPAEREAVGKHPEGTLVVRAFYEGNNVVIQVQEDGKGIDPEKIRKVAVKKGIISDVAAAALSDAEAIRLIMAPGFSTAEQITDVSGRGVGMDVVNTKILNLQGSVDITSELGMGTCFSIYMPLTLAIVNALIVGARNEGFAIPIGDIAEVIKFTTEGIHRVNDQNVIELRGEPLPLYYLSKLTHALTPQVDGALVRLEDVDKPGAAPNDKIKGFVVVVREGSSAMGLVVDALLGQEEVVVKPVTGMFEYNKAVSGATITGDGKVHMILDVPYMMKQMSKSVGH